MCKTLVLGLTRGAKSKQSLPLGGVLYSRAFDKLNCTHVLSRLLHSVTSLPEATYFGPRSAKSLNPTFYCIWRVLTP